MGVVKFFLFILELWASIFTEFYRSLFPSKLKDVKGEIVLVTGAGHGMGRLEAFEFAKQGATVVVVDINEENNKETSEQIRETGGRVYAYTCDVSKRENIKKLAAEIRQDVGDVTILVNNAGVIYVGDIASLTDDNIQRTFDVNVLAHFWFIREFLPTMKQNNHGHIVELASMGGLQAGPFLTDYCSSKHAVIGLCESLRRELRWLNYNGIHVTCICPHFVSTGFVKNPKSNVLKIYTPEEVVNELMTAIRSNVPFVTLPKFYGFTLFLRAILPLKTLEVIFDFIHPECDKDK